MRNIKTMRMARLLAATSAFVLTSAFAGDTAPWTASHLELQTVTPAKSEESEAALNKYFRADDSTSEGSVSVEGNTIDYRAVAGTIIVHPKGWDDAAQTASGEAKTPPTQASMFYVAYFKQGESTHRRPVTFIYNGGPGSSSVWLHMGAFGPRRIIPADDTHTPAAPYRLVNNDF